MPEKAAAVKTTTGRLVLRLLEPTDGEVLYRDKSVFHNTTEEMRQLREKMQVIFQDPFASLSPRMSIGASIGHPLQFTPLTVLRKSGI